MIIRIVTNRPALPTLGMPGVQKTTFPVAINTVMVQTIGTKIDNFGRNMVVDSETEIFGQK